ncbi:mannan endo-1,4-beta-mannosidase 6-like [Silene latifolia]|uniref:mannan endo-1,4-beta-mannosidase 6-like n=1 Tax=Silene latifolia TaxID=37657 RepID=UPI003D7820CB
MNSGYREKYLYPFIGITVTATILYFSFDQHFDFTLVLWQKNMGFVAVESTHFTVTDVHDLHTSSKSTLYVNGWNSYWLFEAPSRDTVSRLFKKASQLGLNVCRTWAFSDGPGPNSLQISPGVFNQKALKELDYEIVEARKNGIRLILSLVNNLSVFGGKEQYVKWAQEAGVNISSSPDPFFSDSTIKGYYKAYIKAIITRKNSLSGVRYSEEPAIFAWELINEPRCDSNSSSSILQAWITEMAAYIKSLDQNHLVTVGLEGFYGPTVVEKSEVNPGEWAALFGTDFIQNSAIDGIDFASVHLYPDSWMPLSNDTEKMNFVSKWMDSHISDAENILKKPVVFTEVGCRADVKDQGVYNRKSMFTVVYDKIFESARKGQAGGGAMIWQLLVEDMNEYGDPFSLVAWNEPTTSQLILKQSCRLQSIFWKSKDLERNDPCYGLVP